MKVLKRIIIKAILLIAVVLISGGGAASWKASRQSSAEYAVGQYLSFLVDNNIERAYAVLDQSEAQKMTLEEYTGALEAKKYSLYSSYEAVESEKRRDSDGREYVDYKVSFKDASGEVKAEESFTVKKQSKAVLGVFDRWKVLSDHCMVKNFMLTVPAGSEVYLDAEPADTAWIERDGVPASYDSYQIPTLIPGKISLVIRHPELESVNATLDALAGSADYTDKMNLKESAKSGLTELGVKLLQVVYSSAVKEKTTDPDKLLAACQKAADTLIKNQGERFNSESAEFKNAAISNFVPQFGDLVFTDEKNGAVTTEMKFSYHYVVREDVTVDTEEYLEDGTPVQQTSTEEYSGDAAAKMTMAYYNGAWQVTELDMQVIPE